MCIWLPVMYITTIWLSLIVSSITIHILLICCVLSPFERRMRLHCCYIWDHYHHYCSSYLSVFVCLSIDHSWWCYIWCCIIIYGLHTNDKSYLETSYLLPQSCSIPVFLWIFGFFLGCYVRIKFLLTRLIVAWWIIAGIPVSSS